MAPVHDGKVRALRGWTRESVSTCSLFLMVYRVRALGDSCLVMQGKCASLMASRPLRAKCSNVVDVLDWACPGAQHSPYLGDRASGAMRNKAVRAESPRSRPARRGVRLAGAWNLAKGHYVISNQVGALIRLAWALLWCRQETVTTKTDW
jgi:hypothetical protein